MERMLMDRWIIPTKNSDGIMVDKLENLFTYIDRKRSKFLGNAFSLADIINTIILPIECEDEFRDEMVHKSLNYSFKKPYTYCGLRVVFMENIEDVGFSALKFKNKDKGE